MSESIRLKGSANFREIGGYTTNNGHRVKRNRIFRTGQLAELTDEDLDIIRKLAIRAAVDMRGQNEVDLYPSRWPEDIDTEWVHAAVHSDIRAGDKNMYTILKADPTPDGAMKMVECACEQLPFAIGHALKAIVDLILKEKTPIVYFCSNGRDRTGVISMLLLYMLGVDKQGITDDYMLTNDYIDLDGSIDLAMNVLGKKFGFKPDYETLRTMSVVYKESVDTVFDSINQEYGTTEKYLDKQGITDREIKGLRELLLEET